MKRVLFLSNGKKKTRIIEELIKNGCHVTNTEKKIKGIGNYDLVISFGYRHILKIVLSKSKLSYRQLYACDLDNSDNFNNQNKNTKSSLNISSQIFRQVHHRTTILQEKTQKFIKYLVS